MIISHAKGLYTATLAGRKTQTRRIHTPRLSVDKTYAIVPKRAAPAWWFYERFFGLPSQHTVRITNPRAYLAQSGDDMALGSTAQINRYLAKTGPVQARIHIDRIHHEPLGAITEADAQAEGVASRDAFAALWDTINTKPGTRWTDNPTVCVVTFHVDLSVKRLYRMWEAQQSEVTRA